MLCVNDTYYIFYYFIIRMQCNKKEKNIDMNLYKK